MAQQTVSRGTCVVEHDSMELGTAGALENSSAIIALSDAGMAFFHVAGSDPEHKDNQAGMSGDFERFAVNAKLFYVVFGSYAKNAPTYTTNIIEGYLNDLNGAATILWYKDGVYSRAVVNSQGEITLSVPLDGMHSTGYSGSTGTTAGGIEPVSLGYYLSASSHVQHSTAIPGFSPEQPQSLFDMLEEGQDTAPAETSVVVIDKNETTLNDMQNLQDILLLKSFISVNAMSLMYKRRDNKPYNLDDKVEAAQFVIDQANALNEVTSKSMGGFLNPTKANAYSYEKSIIGAEVHSEILSFLFSSFSLPEKALAQIDGLLSTANSKLSANIKNTHTTLNHMIYVFTFEPVEGLETVKLPVLRQLYLKVDQKSWEASVQVGKSKASVTKFSFKMNVVDSEWEMNPGQVDRQRTQIQDLLTNMTSANLDQINELASPSVIGTAETPTSSATFQITNGELRFHQPSAMGVTLDTLGYSFRFQEIKKDLEQMALGLDNRFRNINVESLPDGFDERHRALAVQDGKNLRNRIEAWNIKYVNNFEKYIKAAKNVDEGWEYCTVQNAAVQKDAPDLFPGLDAFNLILTDFNNLPYSVKDYAAAEKFENFLVHQNFTGKVSGYKNAIKQIVIGGSVGRSGPNTTTRHLHVNGVATDNLIFLVANPFRILGDIGFHMEKNMSSQQKAQATEIQNRYNADETDFKQYEIGTKGTFRQKL